MDRHRTEIEQVAHEAIIGSTMEIDLGVRSWSNVSPKLSTSALLYDSAWKRAIVVHGDKPKAIKTGGFWPTKKMACSLATLIAASAAIGFGMTHYMGSKPATSIPAAVPPQIALPKAAVVSSAVVPVTPTLVEAPTKSAAAPVVAAPIVVEPVAAAPEAIAPAPAKPVDLPLPKKAPEAAAKPEKDNKALLLPKAPVLPKPQITLPTVPYFPAPLGVPQQASAAAPLRGSEQAPSTGKEEPLLAVDETAKPVVVARTTLRADELKVADTVADKEADARAADRTEEAKPLARPQQGKLAEPKVTEQPMKLAEPREMPRRIVAAPVQADKPLPNYTVLAPSAGGVVISDPDTRLPKEFRVGQKLPSGETIKSVARNGEVTTDKRTLKMSE